jgi:hypothetical protein
MFYMNTTTADKVIDTYSTRHDFRYGDWTAMQEVLDTELAEALFTAWREHSQEPGFMQPASSLVIAVEGFVGEEVWPEDPGPEAS